MSFSQLLPDFVQLVVGERRVARLLERAQRALIRVATEARRLPGRVGRVASRVSLRYIGARTLSRASCTAASGSPTMEKPGRPALTSTSTSTGKASIPMRLRLLARQTDTAQRPRSPP